MLGFPGGSAGKESACNAGDLDPIPGLGRSPWRRERLPTSVCWPGEFHGLYSSWVRRVGHSWATFTFIFMYMLIPVSNLSVLLGSFLKAGLSGLFLCRVLVQLWFSYKWRGKSQELRTRQRKKSITSSRTPKLKMIFSYRKKRPSLPPNGWIMLLWAMCVENTVFFKNWSIADLQCCDSFKCTAYCVFWFQQKTKPLMTEFSVKSTIISRYAFTTVACRMLNRGSEDQEVTFQMQIPAAAFITNFTA